MHGLIRALPPVLSLVVGGLAAGCTSTPSTDDTSTAGGSESTETGEELGPICDGAEPGPDIIINDPSDFDQVLGIECIPGKLLIDAAPAELIDLQGLETVKEIGALEVRYNLTLSSLNGLQNVSRLGSLKVVGNKALPDMAKLESLTQIDGSIIINSNDAMTGLAGLDRLTEAGAITLESNPLLENFTGLSELKEAGTLQIIDNDAIVDATGFARLEQIDGELRFKGNDSLTSLAGFTLLDTVGDTIWISDNTSLPTCVAQDFVASIPNLGGAAQIYDNMADSCG